MWTYKAYNYESINYFSNRSFLISFLIKESFDNIIQIIRKYILFRTRNIFWLNLLRDFCILFLALFVESWVFNQLAVFGIYISKCLLWHWFWNEDQKFKLFQLYWRPLEGWNFLVEKIWAVAFSRFCLMFLINIDIQLFNFHPNLLVI